MRIIKFAIIGILLGFGVACCTVAIDPVFPKYSGVDPEFQYLLNEYLYLADQRGIHFKNTVTVGFEDINQGQVIGECYYGLYFREIYIDKEFWKESTATTRMAEAFHELSHCYCGREHDYGDGKKYKPASDDIVKDTGSFHGFELDFSHEGRFDDMCPLSIMYPRIVPDYCMVRHYSYYTNEMFDRCVEY